MPAFLARLAAFFVVVRTASSVATAAFVAAEPTLTKLAPAALLALSLAVGLKHDDAIAKASLLVAAASAAVVTVQVSRLVAPSK